MRRQSAGRGGLESLLVAEHLEGSAGVRKAPRERLKQHDAQAVPVRLRSNRLRRRLLGSHVRDGPDDVRIGEGVITLRLGDEPEVEQDQASRRCHEDVRRLEVPVDETRRVQGIEATSELRQGGAQAGLVEGEVGRSSELGGKRPPAPVNGDLRRRERRRPGGPGQEPRQEVRPVHELHGEEPLASGLEQLAEAHQVRVMKLLQGPELPPEPDQRVHGERPQCLDRDVALLVAIERLVHDAHPAGAKLRQQLEPRGPCELARPERRPPRPVVVTRHRPPRSHP